MMVTPPDIAIIIILGFFSFNGFRHGFIEEMGRLISLTSGFILASKFHSFIIPYLQFYIESEALQVTTAYLIIFLVTITITSIIIRMLQKFIELVLLGWLNRLLGLLLGLLKGFLIVSLIMFIIQGIPFKMEGGITLKNKLEKESVMYQICNQVKEFIILTVPMENQINFFKNEINKISNEEKNK